MKLVIIVSRFPYPLEKGDKLRAFQHLKQLALAGHEIHLIALSDQPVLESSLEAVKKYCNSIHVIRIRWYNVLLNLAASFFRNLPLQVGYFYSAGYYRRIQKIIGNIRPDMIYCQLIRTALYAKGNQVPAMLDYMDAFSKGTRQRTGTAPYLLRPLFHRELRRVSEFENQCFGWFRQHLVISRQDRDALQVSRREAVRIVPNGVDIDFFYPEEAEKKIDVTFVGNMNYPPNIDGAKFLVEDIMPGVWERYPDATVQISGANPSREVKKLAAEKVWVTGWVDDIRHSYRGSRIFIAPMRIGTGLQNKLLEAMAMAIPCITTPLSFEPLDAIAGKHIFTGNNHQELAAAIIRFLDDEKLRNEIGKNGCEFVRSNYSMQNSSALLLDAMQDVMINK
jgi:sugar transferase (PEP-CTERM/EpsH1 system associated)